MYRFHSRQKFIRQKPSEQSFGAKDHGYRNPHGQIPMCIKALKDKKKPIGKMSMGKYPWIKGYMNKCLRV